MTEQQTGRFIRLVAGILATATGSDRVAVPLKETQTLLDEIERYATEKGTMMAAHYAAEREDGEK